MTKTHKSWIGAVMISVDNLILTSWNCNKMDNEEFAVLCSEIKDGGFDEPCQVVPLRDSDEGKYLVLGGEHRYKASKANGLKEIPCVIKTSLSDADEKDLILWSVRRNNIRGKVDAAKYAQLEHRLNDKYSLAAEAARREMLIKGDTLKNLKRSPALEDNESIELTSDDDDLFNDDGSEPSGSNGDSSGGKARGNRPATDGERDTKKKFADRRALMQALKAAEEEVLLESGDTVEHGYLFFGQGAGLHLVVDENEKLKELISRMVEVCKANSESVRDLLISALTKELPNWE